MTTYEQGLPEIRPVWALRARVLVAQGRWDDALTATLAHGVSCDDELSYVREFGHITLAAVLVAQGAHERADGSLREAGRLLDRLRDAADEGGRAGSAAQILVLQALLHEARGDDDAAVSALERAMRWAEPEGSVRVLRLLRSDLDGPGIARELVVSLNTVRTHTGADADALLTVGSALVAVRDWTFLLGPGMASANALLLGTLVYRSGLVPRVIPLMGLGGAPLLLAANTPRCSESTTSSRSCRWSPCRGSSSGSSRSAST